MWLAEDQPFSFLSGISLSWNLPAFAGLLPTIGDDPASAFAVAALLLSMSTVVVWLTVRIGKGLQQRKSFLFMGILYGICGAARIVSILGYSSTWPAWLVAALHIFVPAALVLSFFMFSSIPPLIKVLRASDEVRSLRGQAKLQALVQAAPMAVVGTDLQGRVTSWNPAAEKIFGYKAEEILGTLAVTHPEDKKTEHHDLLELTFKGTVTKGFESERTDRTGRRFPVSISTAPLHDEAGQLMGLMATIEDITERKSIERELSEETVTLAAATDALNRFLESGDWAAASKRLLSHALEQTQSPCGFLGVVLDGPNLRVLAHEGGTWDEAKIGSCTKQK